MTLITPPPPSTPISSSLQQNIHHLFQIPTSSARMHNPTSCWQRSWALMMDPNGISGSWQWIVDYGKKSTSLPDNIHITRGIHCTSVRPGRGIPRVRLFLRFLHFSCQKGFWSFSLLLLRVNGRGCHNWRSPIGQFSRIWAIQNHHQCRDPGGYSCSMLCSTPF